MNTSSVITANMSFYLAQAQILRNETERQEDKLVNRIKTFDKYRQTEGRQRTYLPDGLGRSGFMELITASDLQVVGVCALPQSDEVTTRWNPGDTYAPSSSSGKKIPILNKTYIGIEDNICATCMTSNKKTPLGKMIINQLEGVQDFEIKTKKGHRIFFEGFEKTSEEKREFQKIYPWVSNTEDLVIEVPGREKLVGEFDESTGLGPGGNFPEWSTRFINDVSIISYNEWKKSSEKKNLGQGLRKWSYKFSEIIRKAYPPIMDQIDTIDGMCEDILDEDVEKIIISAVGERSGIEGKSLRMRTGHAGFKIPEKTVIHINSINKPKVQAEIEASSEEYRRKNVRGIVISQSLRTDSKYIAGWLTKLKIPTYIFTRNIKSKIVEENKERCVEMPRIPRYHLREKPKYLVYPLIGLMVLDSAGAALIMSSKHTVSEMHKED